jgi:dihydroflavonol-4-reductase
MTPSVTALVTGATGFIGSHLVDRLLARRYAVRCLVRRHSSRRYLPVGQVRLFEGDLAGGTGLAEACAGADVVFHLAGVTKARRPSDYYTGNAEATAAVVGACLEAGVPRLVHVSSLAAAGPSPDGTPLVEDAECRPFTHYGKSKLEGERLVRGSALAARAVIVRPPVVYGPRDTDVLHMFRAASRGWLLSIGRQERYFSLIYVRDLVEGLIAAAECPRAAGRTYFLAQPEPLSWSAFFAAAAGLFGQTPRTLAVPRAAAWAIGLGGEVWSRLAGRPSIVSREKIAEACCTYWTCDAGRAARELGFAATTSVPEGMAETIAWYRKAGWLK